MTRWYLTKVARRRLLHAAQAIPEAIPAAVVGQERQLELSPS